MSGHILTQHGKRTAMSRFIASSFSLSLFESSCFLMFFTFSSGLSRYAELEARARFRSLVCSENVSCKRAPSLEAFSDMALKSMVPVTTCYYVKDRTGRKVWGVWKVLRLRNTSTYERSHRTFAV